MQTFTKKEVIKVSLVSLTIGILLSGSVGYFLGKNSDEAKYYKLKLVEQKELELRKERAKKVLDKALQPLYSKESPVIDGDEKGY